MKREVFLKAVKSEKFAYEFVSEENHDKNCVGKELKLMVDLQTLSLIKLEGVKKYGSC